MNKIFGADSPFNKVMTVAWDLMILNLLTLLCSIPIITGGAALTALHYCLIRVVRKQEGYMTSMYFRAFKENFKKSTIIWLLLLFVGIAIRTDWVLISNKTFHYVLAVIGIVTFFLFQYVFPLLSHFENTVFNTIKNSFILCAARFPRTFLMSIIWIVPVEILLRSYALFPLLLMLGISLPAYIGARLYDPIFKMLEPPEEPEASEVTLTESPTPLFQREEQS